MVNPDYGWGNRIRTCIGGVRVRSPTVGRSPTIAWHGLRDEEYGGKPHQLEAYLIDWITALNIVVAYAPFLAQLFFALPPENHG